MNPTEADLYVIVCTDLHTALGPFVDLDLAAAVCKRLTKESECVFVPVRMLAMTDQMKAIGVLPEAAKRAQIERDPGGYL